MVNYTAVIEGLLFLKGDEGATVDEICYCLETSENETIAYLEQLKLKYENEDSGLDVNTIEDKYRIVTKKQFAPYYNKILENPITQKLSNAALEVLAIIAYKQPITRAQIGEIRGVNSDNVVKSLCARDLLKEAGTLDVIGKPLLYETTSGFLDLFNLKSLEDLPSFDNFTLDEEVEHGLFDLRFSEDSEKNE